MSELTPTWPGITDEDIGDKAPIVRSLVVERLEQIWAACAPHITPQEGVRPDPRYIEAGIRVLDRLSRLYRLDHPGVSAPPVVSGTDLVAEVEQALSAIEAKL